MFIVRCPKCKQTMRYQARTEALVTSKKKRCVYCGCSFKIHSNAKKSRIIREEKKNTTTPLFKSKEEKEKFFTFFVSDEEKNE